MVKDQTLLDPSVSRPRIIPNEYAAAVGIWVSVTARSLSRKIHPLLNSISTMPAGEFSKDKTDIEESDVSRRSSLFRPIETKYEWTGNFETALNFDTATFLTEIYQMADSFGNQLSSGLITFMTDTAKAAGQEVDGTGLDIYDGIAEMMEKLEFSFDENGNHNMSIIVHPDTQKKMSERLPTPEQTARMDAIIARKRKEWDASRNRRDLPRISD